MADEKLSTSTDLRQENLLDLPDWFDGKKVNEVLFAEDFLSRHPMICVHGSFFTVDGRISDESVLEKEVYDELRPFVQNGLAKKVEGLIGVLRAECYEQDLPVEPDRIHVANGTLFATGTFIPRMDFCRNRLPVVYNPDAPEPVRWKCFLSELLEPEDILTLQEYMGYCLLPTTKAQKMLMIIGKGGEGKSRIGVVMRALFGDNMANGNLAKVETNRFARADLEHLLVMVDDDMKLEALPQTNYIKTIVTADVPVDLEKKSKQSYQGELYCRFLGFGNGSIKALYDRSHGFFRRQIILTTRHRPKGRVDDPDLAQRLCAEKEGIFLWCFQGLLRLIENNFRFTVSTQAQQNMDAAVSDGNNIVDFMRSEGYIRLIADMEISSRELYALYELWCADNALKPLSQRSFFTWLNENLDEYNLESTNNTRIPGGRRARGYVGIEAVQAVYV